MKLTLMIEGSADVLARALAALGEAGVDAHMPQQPFDTPFPNVPTISTAPSGPASPPMPIALTPPAADSDDDGPANGDAPDVDAEGLPWDERIHSGNKALKANGTWRARRNVDDATVVAVTAELRARGAQQQPAPVAMPQPVEQTYVAAPQPMPQAMPTPAPTDQPVPFAPVAMPMPTPAVQQMQPVPMPVQAPVQQAPVSFPEFMGKLAQVMGAGTVTTEYLMSVVQRVNQTFGTQFNAVTDMAVDPEKLNWAISVMVSEGRW